MASASPAALAGLCDWSKPVETEQALTEYTASHDLKAASPLEHAEFLTQIAHAQCLQHKFADALETLSKAKEIVDDCEKQTEDSLTDSELDADHPVLAGARRVRIRILLEKGRIMHGKGDVDASIAPLRTVLQLSRIGSDPETFSCYFVDALHMLALVETDPDDKFGLLERSIAEAKKSKSRETRLLLASLYTSQAWFLHDKAQNYEGALECFETALVHSKEFFGGPSNKDRAIVQKAQWSIARCKRSLGLNEDALVILEKLGDDTDDVCEEKAMLYQALGQSDKAKDFAAKAIALLAAGKDAEESRLAVLKAI
ncbi:hypothetical protein HDU77_007729 [Chytriomyces hyalinus]|nr:hypothetical protein HDU77_007729 [Chytriomyces hyalinus]